MGKMESALREEISRLAKREIRTALKPLQKQIKDLRDQVRIAKKAAAEGKPAAELKPAKLELPSQEEADAARIGARWIKALRKRNKLSQGQLADLVGVSLSAVGSWEYGRAKPQGENRARLVALRAMSKPDVQSLLGEAAKPKKKATKRRKPVMKKAAKKRKPARKKTAKKSKKKTARRKKKPAKKRAKRKGKA